MLKKSLYILLLFVLPLFGFGKDAAHILFEQGNAQYSKAKYTDAIQSYQKILGEGYLSEAVYFNLGNAYYKSGDIPSALLYFEKARKLAPGDEDINFNIQFTNLKTTDKVEDAPQFFLINWWHSFILSFSAGTLSVLSVLFIISGFGLLGFYLYATTLTLKKAAFYAGIALIFLGLMSVFIAVTQTNYFAAHHQAIVFGTSVTTKSSPDSGAKNLFVIHDGTKVDIIENNNGWLKIRLSNGNEGWISMADAKEI
jgi:tetratricopeptide (TPR) repeat protein